MRAALFALAWVAARADDCDWRAYGERHADVSAAFGADVESLRKHYVAHGKAEGRACPAKAVYHQTGRACEPDCAIDADRLTEEASRPQAWESWGAPGGVDVKYLARPDMADGGGKAAFGDALVERVFASSGVVAPLGVRRCMEFCSGPAFIGFALLGRGACSHLVLAEANPLSVAAARETALANGLRGRVFPYLSDGLDGIPLNETGRLDLVFANPPRSRAGTSKVAKVFRRDVQERSPAPRRAQRGLVGYRAGRTSRRRNRGTRSSQSSSGPPRSRQTRPSP